MVQNQQGNQAPHDQPQQQQSKPICRFYKQGTCRFGIAGHGGHKTTHRPAESLSNMETVAQMDVHLVDPATSSIQKMPLLSE